MRKIIKFLDPGNESRQSEIKHLCCEDTLLKCCSSDIEIDIERGFTLQVCSTKPNTFARCFFPQAVNPDNHYFDRFSWQYDFWFVGSNDTNKIRRDIVVKIFDYLESNKHRIKYRLKIYSGFYPVLNQDKKNDINIGYQETLKNSKFALCPRGNGIQTIRFFEALAATTIPVYIGDKNVKFPLDWIVDWDKAAIKIDGEDGSYGFKRVKARGRGIRVHSKVLDGLLMMNASEINDRRRYIFHIFNTYLRNEKKFDQTVIQRAEYLLNNEESDAGSP